MVLLLSALLTTAFKLLGLLLPLLVPLLLLMLLLLSMLLLLLLLLMLLLLLLLLLLPFLPLSPLLLPAALSPNMPMPTPKLLKLSSDGGCKRSGSDPALPMSILKILPMPMPMPMPKFNKFCGVGHGQDLACQNFINTIRGQDLVLFVVLFGEPAYVV
jgi:hypothetical protein